MTSLSKVSFLSPLPSPRRRRRSTAWMRASTSFISKGLDDIVVEGPPPATTLSWVSPLGGEHDHRVLSFLPDLLEHRPAVHYRQHDVQQHQLRVEGAEQLHPLPPSPATAVSKPSFSR